MQRSYRVATLPAANTRVMLMHLKFRRSAPCTAGCVEKHTLFGEKTMSFALIPLLMIITFTVQDLVVGSYDLGQRIVFASVVFATALLGIVFLYNEYKHEAPEKRSKGFFSYFMHN
jgi:hypothetical protein